MHVQVNASNGIHKTKQLDRFVSAHLKERLARFDRDLIAVEAQFTDENHGKQGAADKRCMLEARVPGRARVAVVHEAPTQDLAFRGAVGKLGRSLDHVLGRHERRDHRSRTSIRRTAWASEGRAEESSGSEPA